MNSKQFRIFGCQQIMVVGAGLMLSMLSSSACVLEDPDELDELSADAGAVEIDDTVDFPRPDELAPEDDEALDERAEELEPDEGDGPGDILFAGGCERGSIMRVRFDRIFVCRTNHDPGSSEEWVSTLRTAVSGGLWESRPTVKHSPPEKLILPVDDPTSCWSHRVDQDHTIPYLDGDPGVVVSIEHWGYENDKWPNADDPLPSMWTDTGMSNCRGQREEAMTCSWSRDFRRFACLRANFEIL